MQNLMNPDIPAGAFDDFYGAVAPDSLDQRIWTPADGALPALYLSHGAPLLLNDAHWMQQLFDWSQSMPKPKAVLIVSAHWETAPLSVSASAAHTPLVYDFGGFARRYYTLAYDTPDAAELAAQVDAVMPDTEPVHHHARRGLDHGAWVPLMVMYPYADVPVLQLSMPTHDPDRLLELGRRLKPLREQGVLVIGSGNMTHGLPYLSPQNITQNVVPGWSADFDAWAAQALGRGDIDTLADVARAPGMPYAHPTVEHYTPLFIALGAATDSSAPATTVIDDFQLGMAKRSVQVA